MDERTNKGLPSLPVPAPSPEIAAPAVPATNPQPQPRPIPKRVREAIKLYTEGHAKTWALAADKGKISREHLSRCLGKPHIAAYLRNRAAHVVAMGVGRAAPRLNQLMDSPSQKVALDAVKFSLGTAGIKPTSDAANVNVSVRSGYIIDLRDRASKNDPLPQIDIEEGAAGAVIVDAKPEPIRGVGPGAKPVE
jgi:hypothetical protein